MTDPAILLVEDDADNREALALNLRDAGFEVVGTGTGEQGLKATRERSFDLVILDLMLPGLNGFEVCKELRSRPETRLIPIIMLTARGEDDDVIGGLEVGADDYLTKPVSPRVLLARVKSLLRRASEGNGVSVGMIECGKLLINFERREVSVGNEPVALTRTEFGLLYSLAARPGKVFTRREIVAAVHGEDYPVTDRSVDVQIVGLRKKLGALGEKIETVRGIGYRFSDSD